MQPIIYVLASCLLCLLAGMIIGATFARNNKTPVFDSNYVTAMLGLALAGILIYRFLSVCG